MSDGMATLPVELEGGNTMCKTRRSIMAERAQNLRRNMTWCERKLWFGFLCEYKPPFRAQKVVGNYILDFYCNQVRLCIELDGDTHYVGNAQKYDEIRTKFLEMEEIEVLRFSNVDVVESFEGVCIAIDEAVQKRRNDTRSASFSKLLAKH